MAWDHSAWLPRRFLPSVAAAVRMFARTPSKVRRILEGRHPHATGFRSRRTNCASPPHSLTAHQLIGLDRQQGSQGRGLALGQALRLVRQIGVARLGAKATGPRSPPADSGPAYVLVRALVQPRPRAASPARLSKSLPARSCHQQIARGAHRFLGPKPSSNRPSSSTLVICSGAVQGA